MKEIIDETLLKKLVFKNEITKYLYDNNYKFRILQFSKGEIIVNMMKKVELLFFVVEGSVQIYGIREDGNIYPVGFEDAFTVIGDVELCTDKIPSLLVEAKSKSICLALSLKENRERLLNDNMFLRFVINIMAGKMNVFSNSDAINSNLEEKLLYYIREKCENNMIKSVEETTFNLRCSRRQLQRVLKKLCDEGKIEKISKGCYELKYV